MHVINLLQLTIHIFAGEVMATVQLDNAPVGHTNYKNCSAQCWDHRFEFDLDRVSKYDPVAYESKCKLSPPPTESRNINGHKLSPKLYKPFPGYA